MAFRHLAAMREADRIHRARFPNVRPKEMEGAGFWDWMGDHGIIYVGLAVLVLGCWGFVSLVS